MKGGWEVKGGGEGRMEVKGGGEGRIGGKGRRGREDGR